jgi:long-chain acyl-CoA synthetase
MEYPPLTKSFLEAVDRFASPRAQMYRTAGGWQSITAQEMLRRVAGLSKALRELGTKSGDRVAIVAPNCPEWHIADFAIQGVGAASVPIYFNESSERLVYILNDSGARIVFTSGEAQERKISESAAKIPALEHVVAVTPLSDVRGEILRYEALIATAGDADVAEYRKRAAGISATQLLTIIYTSGTTGEPKGVMLTHSNVSSNVVDSLEAYDFSPEDLALSFLPLAHVYERTVDYGYLFRGVPIAYVEQMESVPQALLDVKPTCAAAVPRFFEKIYANILDSGHRGTGLKKMIFDWSLRVAQDAVPWRAYGKHPSLWTKQRWGIADRIVYSKIRAGLGGRIRYFFSGGAPLAPELSEFFWSVNLPVLQGYGLTETAPVIASNVPKKYKVGTVGQPISNVEVRIADDGEILVKGPCVMQGYFHKPEQTREVFTSDGWFCTGDIGRLDEDGYLIITDRKKELLKTAAGKFVAPAPIENLLKQSAFITNAIVVGDKRKFVSVLIVPNFSAIENEARKQRKEFTAPSQIISDPWVRDLLSREIERLSSSLAQYEKPKRFALLEQDFTFASGELTYTLKIKRRVIEDRYQDVIARLYADVEEPRPQHSA